jgi:single stranded DNA-binding protein
MRINKQIIGGNLADDAVIRPVSGDRECISFRVITSENWKTADGEEKSKTCGHDVVQFGKVGRFTGLAALLKKGAGVYVEGITEKEMREHEGKDFLNVTVNASFGVIQISKYVTEKTGEPAQAPVSTPVATPQIKQEAVVQNTTPVANTTPVVEPTPVAAPDEDDIPF